MLPKVHVNKEAFFVMAWAAVETFKKECLGLLLGYGPTELYNYYLITGATPFQSVRRRSNTEVIQSERGFDRLNRFFSELKSMKTQYLGDFHSHPEWGERKPFVDMSDIDIKSMSDEGHNLEIIIGISSRRKGQIVWEVLPDGSVKGSIDRYNFHFNAYTLVGPKKKGAPQRLQIVAPSALEALNRIYGHI